MRAAALCLVGLAQAAWALAPQEILVVANGNSPESIELAKFYAKQRGIDDSHLAVVKTTTAYSVTRDDYDAQIRRPLRQILQERNLTDAVRCLALMWGVPVAVDAPLAAPGNLAAIYSTELGKAHYRLAIDYKLLATIGRKFPPPRTEALSPVGDLFEQPPPTVAEPLRELPLLLADIDKVLAAKLEEYRQIADPNHRQIAARQLMAMQLDIHGLAGLKRLIQAAGLSDAPDPNDIRSYLQAAQTRAKSASTQSQPTTQSLTGMFDAIREAEGLAATAIVAKEYADRLKPVDASASVDSELALLWWDDYPLGNWLPNPMCWNIRLNDQAKTGKLPPVMMTARIDGPSPADARKIILDSIETEKSGLNGVFYIDAGGLERAKEYDASFRSLNQFIRKATSQRVVFDEAPGMFQPGSCPQAALYVGWYSLQQYIPAFAWVRGAVGWHVASFEAMHLRDPNSQEWCVKMIQNGVAATIGAIDEPRLSAFPVSQDFFALLLTGRYSLAECYWRTVPNVSWRMTLIGDPLYTPFKTNPQVAPEVLPASLLPKQTSSRPAEN